MNLEKDIRLIVEEMVEGFLNEKKEVSETTSVTSNRQEEPLPDILEIDLKKQLLVPNPKYPEAYLEMKSKSPARVGCWRAGPRMKTESLLRFWTDHAVSQDAVFGEVSPELINKLDFMEVQTLCSDKAEYLKRTDLGRQFSEEMQQKIKNSCDKKPQVQIVVADGLSSTAIEKNIENILPAIKLGLNTVGIHTGKVVFVKYGRVPSMDVISEVTEADVTCLLVGERPGLVTAESMSAYIAYKANVGMPEANRTVISNIYDGGTPTIEAGAHIAEVIKKMLDNKASGVNLKL